MSEQSPYQKRKEVEVLYKGLDRGHKKMLFEMLLEDWVETLPQKGKEQGVTGGGGKWTKRIVWLQEHWGTEFETKGTVALRKMQTDLSNKVNTALTALKGASGEQVSISRSAFNELQRIKREFAEAGGEVRNVDSSILSSLGELLKSLPSVKSEKEVAKYEATKARKKV